MFFAVIMILMSLATFVTTLVLVGLDGKGDSIEKDSGRSQPKTDEWRKRDTIAAIILLACILFFISGFVRFFWMSSVASAEQIQRALGQSNDPECLKLKLLDLANKEAITRDQLSQVKKTCNVGGKHHNKPVRIQQLETLKNTSSD